MAERREFTQSVPLPEGTIYSASVTADDGYTAGKLNNSGGTLTEDITLQATPATPNMCTVSMAIYLYQDITLNVYDDNDTIVRKITNQAATSLPYNTKYSVELNPHEGYEKSELINFVEGYKYFLTRNINISAKEEATPVLCSIILEPTINQVLSIETDGGLVLESDTEDQVMAVAPYWTRYTVTVTPDPGYIAGGINGGENQTINKNSINFTPYHPENPKDETGYMTVRCGSATPNYHNLNIYRYDHQTVIVSVKFNNITTEYTYNSATGTGEYHTFQIFDSSIFTIRVIPDEGYTSTYPMLRYVDSDGNVQTIEVIDPDEEYIMDKNYDAYSATQASVTYFNVSLVQSPYQTISLSSGEYADITGSVMLQYNSEFTIKAVANNPSVHNPGEIITTRDTITETTTPHIYTGIITGDNIIYVTPVTLK